MICYKITNLINYKVYIGITKCKLQKRWNEHKCKAKSSNSHLSKAILKHSIENFKIEILKTFENEKDMYDYEIESILIHNSNNRLFGYNKSTGCEFSSKGRKMPESMKLKISEYQKHRIRLPHSEETKIKMSEKAKGRDMTLAIISSANKRRGKPAKNIKKVILNNCKIYDSITLASLNTGVSVSAIHNNIKGLSKKTKVGIWNYYKQNN